jgi:phospholipid/cholesterol/gamma-HCH transport system substrate-binding protein
MKTSKAIEFRVGLLVFTGIVILVLGIVFGRGLNLSSGKADIKFLFPSSGGLKISDPIFVNGVKRGSVNSIENYHDSVLIIGTIDDVSDIYTDATAKIMILEITGGKKIEIEPGISKIKFNRNNFLYGSNPPDLGELIATFGAASNDIITILHKVDTTLTGLNNVLADENSINNIKSIVKNTDLLIAELKTMFEDNKANLNSTLKDLKQITTDVRQLVSDNKSQMNKIVNNLDTISTAAKPMLKKTDSLLTNLQILSENLKNIVNNIENGKGTVSKLLYDEHFAVKLDSTINSLDTLITFIRKNGVNVNVRLGTRP